jgi:hypothetical protein
LAFAQAALGLLTAQVPLTKQNADLGCLRVREGSHLGFRDFCDKAERFETLKNRSGDWCMLSKEELEKHFPQDKYPMVNVESEPGDVVFWFSHTLHEGQVGHAAPLPPADLVYRCRVNPDPIRALSLHLPSAALPRAAISLCGLCPIAPASFSFFLLLGCKDAAAASSCPSRKKKYKEKLEGKLVKKRVHFLMRRMTSHCPDEPHSFGILPRTYGDKSFETILQAFSIKVEEAALGSVPFLLPKSETPSAERPKKKKSKSDSKEENKSREKKAPLFATPEHLLQAVAQVEAGTFVPSDDVLPLSLRGASAEMKRRLWLLNGF